MKTVYMWGSSDAPKSTGGRRYILPNPWPPDTIDSLILLVATTAGLAPTAYKLVALWVELQKAKVIRIKHGETEVEVRAGVTDKEVERVFSLFRKTVKDVDADNIQIILPSGVDCSLSVEMAKAASEKKGGKK